MAYAEKSQIYKTVYVCTPVSNVPFINHRLPTSVRTWMSGSHHHQHSLLPLIHIHHHSLHSSVHSLLTTDHSHLHLIRPRHQFTTCTSLVHHLYMQHRLIHSLSGLVSTRHLDSFMSSALSVGFLQIKLRFTYHQSDSCAICDRCEPNNQTLVRLKTWVLVSFQVHY